MQIYDRNIKVVLAVRCSLKNLTTDSILYKFQGKFYLVRATYAVAKLNVTMQFSWNM